MTEWLENIRVIDTTITSGANLCAWAKYYKMVKNWYNNCPHKIMVF